MEILVKDIVNKIKEIFNDTKVLSVDTVYEKTNTQDLRLVISMNKILYDDVNIIYTKIIFNTDYEKIKLTKNHFAYLFDINCEYVRIDFVDIDDFSNKISNIFKNNKFGENIKILSEFIKSPSTLINTWFEENKISDISIINVKVEKIEISPCKFLNFEFSIDLNNNQNVKMVISKESDSEYLFSFEFLNDKYEEKTSSLKSLVETIGSTIKNKIQM